MLLLVVVGVAAAMTAASAFILPASRVGGASGSSRGVAYTTTGSAQKQGGATTTALFGKKRRREQDWYVRACRWMWWWCVLLDHLHRCEPFLFAYVIHVHHTQTCIPHKQGGGAGGGGWGERGGHLAHGYVPIHRCARSLLQPMTARHIRMPSMLTHMLAHICTTAPAPWEASFMALDPLMLDPEDLEDDEEGMMEFLVRLLRGFTFWGGGCSAVAVCAHPNYTPMITGADRRPAQGQGGEGSRCCCCCCCCHP